MAWNKIITQTDTDAVTQSIPHTNTYDTYIHKSRPTRQLPLIHTDSVVWVDVQSSWKWKTNMDNE